MTDIPDHPVYSKNVLEMLTVANDYCITLSKSDKLKKDELTGYLTKVCSLLYLKGSLIPEVEIQYPDYNERFVTEQEWEELFNSIRSVLGKDDEYWMVDLENFTEMVKASVAEFLADIYQDLNDFLLLYQKNSIYAKENAVGELRRLFIENWGPKILSIQIVLHNINYNPKPGNIGFNIPELF